MLGQLRLRLERSQECHADIGERVIGPEGLPPGTLHHLDNGMFKQRMKAMQVMTHDLESSQLDEVPIPVVALLPIKWQMLKCSASIQDVF